MKPPYLLKTIFLFFAIAWTTLGCKPHKTMSAKIENNPQMDTVPLTYTLPTPNKDGNLTVEEALSKRRSHRHFQNRAISVTELSQVLWASYGVTMPREDYSFLRGGLRTAPSAGALYPLEIYVLVGNVKNMEQGVYKYISEKHKMERTIDKDIRENLCNAALNQEMIQKAPAVLVYSAVFSRTENKYGDRGRERYVYMEVGHSAQNVYLQVESLHMGTCAIGAFDDEKVKEIMQLPAREEPLYIMPIGYYYNKVEF